MPQSFPPASRLRRAEEFRCVFRDGNRSRDGLFTVLAIPGAVEHARLGLAISKKVARHAVMRNRIKRQIRESFRLGAENMRAMDIVVLANAGATHSTGAQMRESLARHWERLSDRCAESPSA